MHLTDFYDDPADLDKIDWPLMTAKWWNDTQEDPDRSRRRQAEFLVHRRFPWRLVADIAVKSVRIEQMVCPALDGQGHVPMVSVRRDWYY